MKLLFPITALISSCLTVVCAQTTKPTTHSIATSTPHTSSNVVHTLGKCSFRITDITGHGKYSDGGYTFLDNSPPYMGQGFSIACQTGSSQDDIDTAMDAKQIRGQWVWIDSGKPFAPAQHFHLYKIVGKNWTGTGTTYDDITGEESQRGRNFQYCLFETHGPQILCGGPIGVMTLSAPKSTNTLSGILAALKTIEFVDPPTTAAKH